MAIIYYYRIYCNTDSKYEYVWGTTEPTTCPTNTAHTIDSTKTAIVDSNDESMIIIDEEPVTSTGGNFQAGTLDVGVSDTLNAWEETDFSWPVPMGILSAQFLGKSSNEGDKLEVLIGPNTITGTITQAVSVSDTKIFVSSTVLANIKKGFYVTLDDGTNVNNCGRCIEVYSDSIDIEIATSNSFAVATPTYIKQTVKMIPEMVLTEGMIYRIGESKIGASYLPSGTIIRCRIQNNQGGTGKKFYIHYDALY